VDGEVCGEGVDHDGAQGDGAVRAAALRWREPPGPGGVAEQLAVDAQRRAEEFDSIDRHGHRLAGPQPRARSEDERRAQAVGCGVDQGEHLLGRERHDRRLLDGRQPGARRWVAGDASWARPASATSSPSSTIGTGCEHSGRSSATRSVMSTPPRVITRTPGASTSTRTRQPSSFGSTHQPASDRGMPRSASIGAISGRARLPGQRPAVQVERAATWSGASKP
jgi:hypothetical protein